MIKRIFLTLLFFTNAVFAFNPKDPIAYEVLQSIPSSVTTNGGVYVESLIFKNQTGYTLVHPLVIAKSASPSGEFTYTDNCSGKLLINGETCTVQADLTPVTDGAKNLQFIIEGYSKQQVPVPQPGVTTTASGNSSVSVSGIFTGSPWLTTMSVGQSQNFSFSFTNNGSSAATGIGVSCPNAATCTSQCGSNLAPTKSCTVSGTFTATSAMANTNQVVSAAFKYNQGSTVTVSSPSVHINPNTGFVGTVVPSTATLVQSQPVLLTFTYTNYYTTTNVTIPSGTFTPTISPSSGSRTFAQVTNTCSGATVYGTSNVGSHTCTITGNYTDKTSPTNPETPVTVTGTLTTTPAATNPAATLTVTGTSGVTRTITFNNTCPSGFNIWIGMNAAAYTVAGSDSATPITKTCSTQADCPTGTTCNAGTCYWNTYPTSSGSFELAPSGTTKIVIPSTAAINAEGLDDANRIFWSGGFAGRTGCTASGCITADCGQGTDGCQPGVGFNAPDTQAEMTLQPATTDTYDLETIDGFNIPVSVTPGSGASPSSGYSCSIAGDFSAQGSGTNQFSACNWSLSSSNFPTDKDPSTFYWVSAGGATCSTQTDCSSYPNTICGIAQVPVDPGIAPPKIAKSCGKFLGYMTAKQACAYDIPNGSVNAQALGFNCNTNTSEGGQVSNLYGCTDTYHPSCYSSGTPCCGCEKWQAVLPAGSIPTSAPEQCTVQDANWLTYVPDNITWMKKTCSNVYTYPYDDKTSTFTCSNGGTNSLNYTVTFCPGGNTGIPSTYSADEGRNG